MKELLETYCQKWKLTSPTPIATTPTSNVYRVHKNEHNAVLKIYTDLGREHEALGPIFLNLCRGNNVVPVLEYDEGACLLEFIDGPELLSLVENKKDNQATEIIAKVLNKIHSTSIPKQHSFPSLREHIGKIFTYNDDDTPEIILRAAKFSEKRLEKQEDTCLLHADMHHKNVMLHSKHGWIALDPQCAVGDRAYDCANTLHNPHQRPDLTENEERLLKQANILGENMNISSQRIIDYAYIHGCLSACWTKEDEGHYGQDALNTSNLLEPYISKDL